MLLKRHCEQSEAISSLNLRIKTDCFGIKRLAMTILSNISDVSKELFFSIGGLNETQYKGFRTLGWYRFLGGDFFND
jgi:hypothetical protein